MSDKIRTYFETTVSRELLDLIAGKRIGLGIAREVFEYLPDKSLVLKFEYASGSFQNAVEWEIWDRVKKVKGIAASFAPCVSISPCGLILLQKRTEPGRRQHYPERMPAFFGDFKYSNYGFIGNKLVCHDYGTALVTENGLTTKTKKANWWHHD